MRTAHLFAERSTCNRGKVGAVLVANRRIIAHGYNGAPPGLPHCEEVGCEELTLYEHPDDNPADHWAKVELGCQRTVHAEANALAYAARHGIATEGAYLFCTYSPCRKCLELCASAGIAEIIYDKPYRATPWDLAVDLAIPIQGKEHG